MNLCVPPALLVTSKAMIEITNTKQYPEYSELCFGILNILTLVTHYVLGPERGPSVDCLSTSPKAALGNGCKQRNIAVRIMYLSTCLYRECMTGRRCEILPLIPQPA